VRKSLIGLSGVGLGFCSRFDYQGPTTLSVESLKDVRPLRSETAGTSFRRLVLPSTLHRDPRVLHTSHAVSST
jgi:hypothetical protein